MDKRVYIVIFILVAGFSIQLLNIAPAMGSNPKLVDSEKEYNFKEASEEMGVRGDYLREMHRDILKNYSSGINTVMVKKDGELIFEQYYNIKDWDEEGKGVESRLYIDSITKSILSALVGIAIEEGIFEEGLESTPFTLFEDYSYEDKYPKGYISLKNLLMMKSGFYWVENTPFVDRKMMWQSDNPIAYSLRPDMLYPAGKHFNFNSGISVVIGRAIEELSGEDLEDYANTRLFEPLGIDAKWYRHELGMVLGSDGLFLSAKDLMKFLELYRQGGMWEGKQIVPEEWIKESTKEQTNTYVYPLKDEGYGYHWWIPKFKADGLKLKAYGAFGHGGKRAIVFPEEGLSIVILGDVKREEYVYELIKGYILPAAGLKEVQYSL